MSLIGHGWALDHLLKQHRLGSLRHSHLLLGPAHVGKTTLAVTFAQSLVCEAGGEAPCGVCRTCGRIERGAFPDVAVVEPAGAAFSIEQVRDLSAELPLSPLETVRKVRILAGFESATREAQNALLKTLEEPPSHALLFLTAPEAEAMVPTIASRCQTLKLRPVPVPELAAGLRARGVEAEEAEALALASGGRPGWALQALTDPNLRGERAKGLSALGTMLSRRRAGRLKLSESLGAMERPKLLDMLGLWQQWWHDLLLLTVGAEDGYALPVAERPSSAATLAPADIAAFLAHLTEAERMILRNGNTRLVMNVLSLRMPQITDSTRR
ncbi:MAG: DNA polymerase III subunit [Anaerolineae bacterium]